MADQKNEHTVLNEQKWDSKAENFEAGRFVYFRAFQRIILRMADLKPGVHFLDIGCGTGWAVRHAASLLMDRGEFYGVDISGNMVGKARTSSNGFRNVHFHQADAEQLPVEDGFFDCVICTNSFHHYFNPSNVVNEIYRVLRSNGRFYVLDVTADLFLIRFIDQLVKEREREHVRFYSSREFRTLFEQARLRYVRGRYIAFPEKVHIGEKPAPS